MTFNSAVFAAFFPLVFVAYYHSFSGRRARIALLLLANLTFYGSWNVAFLPYLLGTGTLDFLIARGLAPDGFGNHGRRAKGLLGLSLASNLGVLVFFKYLGFFWRATSTVLQPLGIAVAPPAFQLLVPLGISFYTFQSMSYTLDVYRGAYPPKRSLLEFLTSLTFFPHLLAGPIIRFADFFPQFQVLKRPSKEDCDRALMLIAVGLSKKVMADLVAPIVNRGFFAADAHSPLGAWAAVLGFAAQMYGDFSGYSDMAIGVAALLGFALPPNFNLPYFSHSPVEYWKRWHISLSTWIRDYLYFPLAIGPLRGRPYLNLIFVMTLIGLWHGAGLNYVAFGVYHGLLLAATYGLAELDAHRWIPWRWAKVALTFYLVVIGQAIFRARSPAVLLSLLKSMHFLGGAGAMAEPHELSSFAVVVVALVAGHALDYFLVSRRALAGRPVLAYAAATISFAFAIVAGSRPSFIYFQF